MGGEESFVTRVSRLGFAETVEALGRAIEASGNTIFGRLDQAAEAAKAGAALRPTMLLTFGNPRAGTPLMAAAPTLALDLPLRAVVWEDSSGRVAVSYNVMRVLAARHGAGVEGALETLDAKVAAMIEGALR
ncbi:MAG: DUF302 domain-containing protein [Vulcanimicrobiaceae bacterium]